MTPQPADHRRAALLEWASAAILLLGLPLLGVGLTGKPLAEYAEFPPLTRYVEHAGFSWAAWIGLTAFYALTLGPLLRRGALARSCGRQPQPPPHPTAPFPWWGWLGLGLTIASWLLAWTRFPWFATVQPYTFTPQWVAYILVVNACCVRRRGTCLMLRRPLFFACLFPLSAVFWWFFEYLNRFVQNWYYVGIAQLSPGEYVFYATLPFATVLPAVLSTRELLASWSAPWHGFRTWRPVAAVDSRPLAGMLLLGAAAALAGIGIWPDLLFPVLWVSPLLILVTLRLLRGRRHILSSLANGDWRLVVQFAAAALVCGFFWELWNVWSLAKWEYAVPFVNRFQLFEMPLLGYGGYLPFGVECGAAAMLLNDLLGNGKAVTSEEEWP